MNTLKKTLATGAMCMALAGAVFAQTNVTTWQMDLQHTGANLNETTLTPTSVLASNGFGLLFTSPPMNGQIYGQPLYVSGVTIGGASHNVVYLATQRDMVYAVDGDSTDGTNFLWSKSLLPAGTTYPYLTNPDISDALGITATPVIDVASQTIYVLAKVQYTADNTFKQFLHALDLKTGAEKFGGPVQVNPSFAGSSNLGNLEQTTPGVINFDALHEHDRAALILYNGIVYLTYASHNDQTPYHGEILGYDATSLQLVKSFIATPNGDGRGGMWNGGASPSIDSAGNMYVATGNGVWDQNSSPYTSGTDWSMSMLKLPTSGNFTVTFPNSLNWFTPSDWTTLNNGDLDLGSSGLLLLPDQAGGTHTHLLVGGGKGGTLYVVDRDNMGGLSNTFQQITEPHGLFSTPAYFNGYIYYAPSGTGLEQRAVGYNAVTHNYISPTAITSNFTYNGGHGADAFITANGNTNGVVWVLDIGTPAHLHAYNATSVAGNPIFSGAATLGGVNYTARKFTIPTAVNGKAYFTADINDSSSRLFVFGPPPPAAGTPTAPTGLVATANASNQITLTWSDNSTNETGFIIKRGTSATGPFTALPSGANANDTAYIDASGLSAGTTYYYQVLANNAVGPSAPTNTASGTTFPFFNAPGLVSYWPLDETSGGISTDATGSGRNGTWNGEANPALAFINFGMNIHGTGAAISNVSIPNSAALQFTATQSFTLSAWLHPEAAKASEQAAISKSFDTGAGYYGISINASNQWTFRGAAGDVAGTTAATGAWTHVAVVQDGTAGTRKIYVNGVLAGTGATAAQAANGTGALWFGQANPGTGVAVNSFGGDIDEVRLYNRALAASEITTLMGPPVLQAVSSETQGSAGTFKKILIPAATVVTEPRKGSPVGTYNLVLSFSAPVSGITPTLGLQGGGTAIGSVGSSTLSGSNKILTVVLTGVANNQALNLHLAGITPGNGTADIPFNVLWEDVNGDGVVNTADLNLVQANRGAALTDATAIYDINGDGAINATDETLVAGDMQGAGSGGAVPVISSSATSTGTVGNAFTYNITASNSPTSYNATGLPVGLSINNASGTISGTPTTAGDTTVTLSAINAFGPGAKSLALHVDPQPTTPPTINSSTTAAGVIMGAFNYQINATGSPISYTATNLPPGLSINPVSGAITGLPVASGSTAVVLTAKNNIGTSANFTLTISVTGGSNTNLALTSAGAIATTDPATYTGTNSPALAQDASYGPNGTRWESTHVDTQNYVLDLGKQCSLQYIILDWEAAAGKIYTIDYSTDGQNWTNIGGETANTTAGFKVYTPQANSVGRYVRMNGTLRDSGYGYSLYEFSVWGTAGGTTGVPVINSGLTKAGTVGAALSYTITATNSPTGFTATNLPPGMTFSGATISGTPSATGTTNTTITASNGSGTDTETLVFTISAAGTAPVITSATTATGTMGTPFSYTITATNNPTGYLASPLPPGLTLTGATISGTPTATGPTNTVVTASNGSGNGTQTVVITINAASGGSDVNLALNKLAIGSQENGGTLPSYAVDGSIDSRWGSDFSNLATADTQSLVVDLGQIDTIHSVVMYWENAYGKAYQIDVSNDGTTWNSTPVIANVTNNSTFGKTSPLTYTAPAGTTGRFVRMQGVTRGSPYGYSIYEFQVMGVVGTSSGAAPVINSSLTQSGTMGTALSYTITASNTPTTFTATPLPPGLTLSGATISGTPTAAGTTSTTITAQNASGTDTETLVFTIAAAPTPPVINSSLTASGTVGVAFNYQITATNTPTSFSSSILPIGLTLNATTGAISGIPNASAIGATNVTITAMNGSGSDNETLVITVGASSDTNLAVGKVSSASSSQAGNGFANGNDGVSTTRWAAADGTFPQTWTVDLGASKTLSRIDIPWYSSVSRAYKYKVETSADGITYSAPPVVDKTANTAVGDTSDPFTATARFVRITVTGSTAGFASAYEFKIFGH